MSKTPAADAQDSQTATGEENSSSAVETQLNTQGEKAPAKSADGDDYLAEREAFLTDEQGFLKANGAADAAAETEETTGGGTQEAQTEGETTEADATDGKTKEGAEATEEAEEETAGETTPKRKHVNLARMGEEKAKLVMFLDQNPGVPLEKAVEILGLKLNGDQQNQQQETESGLPKTAAEAQAKADELFEQGIKAQTDDLDFARGGELLRESRKLEKLAGELKVQEQQVRSEETHRINSEFEDSKRNAVKYYPDASKADSPLVKKMLELDALLEETGDERFNSPDKPFLLAKLAAKELGIAPKNPNKQSPPPAPSKVQQTSPVQPARGNARTQQTNTREGTLDEVVDSVRDEDSYEAAKKRILQAA
ncbi:MAG: hypothetical protein WCK57_00675 [Verrucomicrobiae bacterium]